jgi:hypothetical protein
LPKKKKLDDGSHDWAAFGSGKSINVLGTPGKFTESLLLCVVHW